MSKSVQSVTTFLPVADNPDRANAYYVHDLLPSGHTGWTYMPASVRKQQDPDFGDVILFSRRGAPIEILGVWEGLEDAILWGTSRLTELGYTFVEARLENGRVRLENENEKPLEKASTGGAAACSGI